MLNKAEKSIFARNLIRMRMQCNLPPDKAASQIGRGERQYAKYKRSILLPTVDELCIKKFKALSVTEEDTFIKTIAMLCFNFLRAVLGDAYPSHIHLKGERQCYEIFLRQRVEERNESGKITYCISLSPHERELLKKDSAFVYTPNNELQ